MRKLIAPYRCRGYWDPTKPSSLPKATDAASMREAIGRDSIEFVRAYIYFREQFDKDTLGIAVPPKPRVGHPEDNERVVDYWVAVSEHVDHRVRLVGSEALIACSIQISESNVERSFAQVTNRQSGNTLLAGDRYLYNLAMLGCNQVHLRDMYTLPMRELASKLGR